MSKSNYMNVKKLREMPVSKFYRSLRITCFFNNNEAVCPDPFNNELYEDHIRKLRNKYYTDSMTIYMTLDEYKDSYYWN